jgi:ACR3 family arsenite efflux pump ArsB
MSTANSHGTAYRLVSMLPKRLTLLVPAAMLLGLLAGLLVDMSSAKSLVVPLTMLMVYPMLVSFRPTQAASLKDAKAVGLATGLNFIALPAIAWLLAGLFFREEPGLFVGMLLVGLFPTSGMTISWTGLAKGNVAAAVKMTIVGLLVASVLAPLYLSVLGGAIVDVDVWAVSRTVLLVVFVPMLAGVLTRRLLVSRMGQERCKQEAAPLFPGLSTLGVLAIVFLAIGMKAPMIVSSPLLLALVAVPLLLFYAAAFAIATVLARATLSRCDAVAVVFGTAMRNLSIALGIAVAPFGPEAALVLAGAYIVQVQGAAWYVKLSGRALGPAEECSEESAPRLAPAS